MAKKAISSLQASDHFVVTPSDTLALVDDPGNTNEYTFCYLHNAGATGVQVRVRAVDGGIGLIYLNAGQTSSLMIDKIFASSPTSTGYTLYAQIGRGGY